MLANACGNTIPANELMTRLHYGAGDYWAGAGGGGAPGQHHPARGRAALRGAGTLPQVMVMNYVVQPQHDPDAVLADESALVAAADTCCGRPDRRCRMFGSARCAFALKLLLA